MNIIKTIPNFRDLGGMMTRNGSSVKAKKLLRSGALNQISETDKQLLSDTYQVRLIVDFRNLDETAAAPDDPIDGSTYLHINVMRELDNFNTGLENLLRRVDKTGVDNDLNEVYQKLVLNAAARQEFGRFIRQTATLNQGACLFHCFAGKDRTGVAAALLLELLGVSREAIFDDYLKTNILRQPANQIILDEARQRGLSPAQAAILEQMLLVKKEYLETMYEVIDLHYQNFDNYLATGLGVTAADQERLQQNFLINL